jgi:peptidoglycan/LPS O-acetylase OafA/YrhL
MNSTIVSHSPAVELKRAVKIRASPPPFPSRSKPLYFPGLNALRFIGALTVIIQHIEFLKLKLNYQTVIPHPSALRVGEYGVTLFFVLSGFLITYLLFVEKREYGTIDIKSFYGRRILRIWPLYYLLLAIAILVLPNIALFGVTENHGDGFYQSVGNSAPWYVFMLANVAFVTGNIIPYAVQLWSVACEEQFYLIWPHLVKNTSRYLLVFFLFIVGSLFVANAGSYISFHYGSRLPAAVTKTLRFIADFFYYFRISSMAIGGLGAYIFYYKKQAVLQVLYSKVTQVISLAGVLCFVLCKGTIPYAHHAVLSVLFMVLILNIATNKRSLLKLENKVLNYLGGISYGFYMYHLIAIAIVYSLITRLFSQPASSQLANYLLYGLTIVLTIGFSDVSYRFVESPFLKLKKRFTKVSNTDGVAI